MPLIFIFTVFIFVSARVKIDHTNLNISPVQNFAVLIFAKSARAGKTRKFAPCKNFPLYCIKKLYLYSTHLVWLLHSTRLALTLRKKAEDDNRWTKLGKSCLRKLKESCSVQLKYLCFSRQAAADVAQTATPAYKADILTQGIQHRDTCTFSRASASWPFTMRACATHVCVFRTTDS